MYLLDTDTLTHFYAGNVRVREHIESVSDPDVGTTIITRAEMLRGRVDFLLKAAIGADVVRAQLLLQRTEAAFEQLLVLPFTTEAATQFDLLRTIKSYRKIGHADLLIASIVLAHRATLVTRNVRHFRQIQGIHVVNWVDA